MSGDLATMKARISRDIARPDFPPDSQDIADAINTAIEQYQNQRFRFSDTIPNAPPSFNTVAGRYIYTSADNPNIGTLMKIDYVLIRIGNIYQGLGRTSVENVTLYNQLTTMQGQPSSYAYGGNQLLLAAVPSQVWPMILGLFLNRLAPATDDEADNPWMTDAELLIRSRAKYEIATHRTRNQQMAAAMSPDVPARGQPAGATYAAWSTLKSEANRVAYTGRVRPMRF